MIMHDPLLPIPVIDVFPRPRFDAKLVPITRVPTFMPLVLHPGKAFGRQPIELGAREFRVEGFQLATCTGQGERVALVRMIVVVVVTVVAAVVLTVGCRQVSGGRVNAEAFREADDIAFKVAVGSVLVVVEFPRVEGWVGCWAHRESANRDVRCYRVEEVRSVVLRS